MKRVLLDLSYRVRMLERPIHVRVYRHLSILLAYLLCLGNQSEIINLNLIIVE